MSDSFKIRDLDKLLQAFFDRNFEKFEYSTTRLTAPGENYGSLMLQVKIKLYFKSNDLTKELNLVAKMSPPNEWVKKMFNTLVTFKKEIAIYKTIFPALREFQKEQGVLDVIDCIPRCYGARISLDPASDIVDDDAVLLLDNLKTLGFTTVDRMKGFDMETTRIILKDLATLHAVPIALKILNPDVFKSKVLLYLEKAAVFGELSEDVENEAIRLILEHAKANLDCIPWLPTVEATLRSSFKTMNEPLPISEPFATITHNDYWVNNTMIKFENNKPVKNKMVDFQLIDYGSPAKDVIFFLFSSVQKDVLEQHYDTLIKLYYNVFIKTLQDLKCDIKPFTFELFQEELAVSAKTTQFLHVMLMLRPIFALKSAAKDVEELSEEDLLKTDHLSDEYKRKVPEKILQFVKRGWL